MPGLNTITLLLSGLTLPLGLSFLLIVLWSDRRQERNRFFAAFLLFVCLWNAGSFMVQALTLLDMPASAAMNIAVGLAELGFTGASVAVYVLTAVTVRMGTRRFRWLAFASLLIVLAYQIVLTVNRASVAAELPVLETRPTHPLSALFFLLFGGATLLLIWRYRRKIRSRALRIGLTMFVIGQGIGFLNPALGISAFSLSSCAIAALIVSFAVLQEEIIRPLAERNSQVEAIRGVNIAITQQASITSLLNQIAHQAAALLGANGVAIFLDGGGALQIAHVYNLPQAYLDVRMTSGDGLAGEVVERRQPIILDDYGRDWRGDDSLVLAKETFGSVICAPLLHGAQPIGALMVVAGRQGRLFGRDDAHLLELLGAQAVVAIVHSQLLEDQQQLTRQVDFARSQLETVLVSTESPVIAVDRRFRVIFANPAARALFASNVSIDSAPIWDWVPDGSLPTDARAMLKAIRRSRAYTYEIAYNDRYYQCHLAALGGKRVSGWVAVLNDVTQLKELDRMKSEMVRMTSHDLKNPLQAAMANLELLQDDAAALPDGEIHESIAQIDKQLQRMHRIISGILDLERAKMGARTMERCPPSELVTRAVEEMQQLADDKRVVLGMRVFDNLPSFTCDVEQFERALSNLVENAIKFTPAGGNVLVQVRQENGTLVFEVEDTGVGIAEEMQTRVFDRVFRVKQKGLEHVTGSGLGLSLVKAIVESHHGRVSLSSQVGVGSCFRLIIPLHAARN